MPPLSLSLHIHMHTLGRPGLQRQTRRAHTISLSIYLSIYTHTCIHWTSGPRTRPLACNDKHGEHMRPLSHSLSLYLSTHTCIHWANATTNTEGTCHLSLSPHTHTCIYWANPACNDKHGEHMTSLSLYPVLPRRREHLHA